MRRLSLDPRRDWQGKVEAEGFRFHTFAGETYWDESACYRFSLSEVDEIEAATEELYKLCLTAVDEVIRNNWFERLKIPEIYAPLIKRSWEADEPAMYGRFDFSFDGEHPPKLLEFNADTPTALLEASVIQWFWMKERFPDADQFNSIHEKLIEFWQKLSAPGLMHFACVKDSDEDLGTIEYIRDTAIQAGLETRQIFVEDIGWNPGLGRFLDLQEQPIEAIFKLYPWEWLFEDEFGAHLEECGWRTIEPPWKAILSNKGILPILWELFENHANLLPSFFENRFPDNFVRKPLFSREGSNVAIFRHGSVVAQDGTYGKEGFIYQRYHPLPKFDGNTISIGSWVVDGRAAGMGIREDSTEITTNKGRFVPHYFKED
jgi:glutathionylspermidine synthase